MQLIEAGRRKGDAGAAENIEAEEALASLGFPRQKIKESLKNIPTEKTVDEKIKEA